MHNITKKDREERRRLINSGWLKCCGCENVQKLEFFAKGGLDAHGEVRYKSRCKKCVDKKRRIDLIEFRKIHPNKVLIRTQTIREKISQDILLDRKFCKKCQTYHPRSNFGLNKGSVDGLHWSCKETQNKIKREWSKKNIDKVKASAKKSAIARKCKMKDYQARWYQKNKEKKDLQNKKWKESNPERILELRENYKENNLEKIKEYKRSWHKQNPEKTAAKKLKRRKLLIAAHNEDSDKAAENRLYSLAIRLTEEFGEQYVVDHIFPLSCGGPHHHDNLQVIRGLINLKKHNNLNYRHSEIKHWTQLETHILQKIDRAKLLEAYEKIGEEPPKRISTYLTEVRLESLRNQPL